MKAKVMFQYMLKRLLSAGLLIVLIATAIVTIPLIISLVARGNFTVETNGFFITYMSISMVICPFAFFRIFYATSQEYLVSRRTFLLTFLASLITVSIILFVISLLEDFIFANFIQSQTFRYIGEYFSINQPFSFLDLIKIFLDYLLDTAVGFSFTTTCVIIYLAIPRNLLFAMAAIAIGAGYVGREYVVAFWDKYVQLSSQLPDSFPIAVGFLVIILLILLFNYFLLTRPSLNLEVNQKGATA